MQDIGAVNYVLLTLLLLAAGASIVLGLRATWQRMAPGQGLAGLRENFARVNWASFWTRGVLISKVFRRPASGFAHGLLFFGSLFEILGHALYPLSFLGIPVYSGTFGFVVMELGRELAGIAMLLGAAFLLLRRVWPPDRLTAGKSRRGFVPMEVLLIAIIIAGFMVEAVRLAQSGSAGGGEFLGGALADGLRTLAGGDAQGGYLTLWWLHGLLGLAFIVLITRTPMSHMLLGPINAALARRRPGVTLPPIDFEVDEPALGAEKLADLPLKSLLDAAACLWCGRCHEVCPATQTGKPLSPKKIMLTLAEHLEQGKREDATLVDELGVEALFNCTTCAACVQECPVTNNPAEAIVHFRRNLVMARSEMPEVMASANKNLEARGHPFVGTSANRDDWRRGLDVPFFEPGKTEYLLWIGCSVAFEERAQQVARAMVAILNAAGVSWGILEESRCTGDPAKMMGNELLFVELAQANIEEFRELEVAKVITMCAHCFNSFDRYYPELGANWQTVPHSVLIDRLIRDGKLRVNRDATQKITFHDPCYHARHNDIVDESRSVVTALGELVEMPRNRKDSFCCGAGGGNYWAREGGTALISDVRANEALGTGADKIATSCPFCLLMLSSGTARHTEQRKVFDVAELVLEALADDDSGSPDVRHDLPT